MCVVVVILVNSSGASFSCANRRFAPVELELCFFVSAPFEHLDACLGK
jgi:hypothetical protein